MGLTAFVASDEVRFKPHRFGARGKGLEIGLERWSLGFRVLALSGKGLEL